MVNKGDIQMKVLITHIPNTYNYGSAMMAVNLIYSLNRSINQDISFYTDCATEEDLGRLKKSTGLQNIYRYIDKLNEDSKKKSKLIKIITLPFRYKNRLNSYKRIIEDKFDAIIVLGGDDLSEYYSNKSLIKELDKIYNLSKKAKTLLVGQTIGPFTSYRKLLAKNCLKNSYIYARDERTLKYLQEELKINSSFSSVDLAFLDLPNQKEDFSYLEKKYGTEDEKYIVVVPSGLVNSYVDNKELYVKSWVDIIRELLSHKDLVDKKIVLLSHVLKPSHVDDSNIINLINLELTGFEKERIITIMDPLLPEEARYILSRGVFTLTGRMHAAVSTFQTGKPAISLSYSVKYGGVIGETLGFDELIIDSIGNEKWESGILKSEIIEKVDYIVKKYDELLEKIEGTVSKVRLIAEDNIKSISKVIDKNAK
jgi:colanic acid/amylovoran biosynthesis protein